MTQLPLNLVFARERSFSQKLNAAFAFVGHNARTLIPNLLLIPGPFALLAGIGYGIYQTQTLGNIFHEAQNPFEGADMPMLVMAIVLMIGGFFLSSTLSAIVVFLHIDAHTQEGSGMVPLAEMWPQAWKSFGRMLGFSISFTILFFLFLGIAVLPVALISSLVPLLGVFLIFFLMIGLWIIAMSFTLGYSVYWYERKNAMSAIMRIVQLHSGWKWFSTAGLVFVLMLLAGTMAIVFAIPLYGIMGVKMYHAVQEGELAVASASGDTFGIATILASILMTMGQNACYSIVFLGAALQYFNLVERREARGLLNRIEEFGKQPA
jgi:hypothetical protein